MRPNSPNLEEYREITFGDAALGSTVCRWSNVEIESPTTPNLKAWHERFTTRPAYRTNVMVPFV